MTIPQRILSQLAAGAGLVIAVAMGVTCWIVYDGARQRMQPPELALLSLSSPVNS